MVFFVISVLDSSKATELCCGQSYMAHIFFSSKLISTISMRQTYQLKLLLLAALFLLHSPMHCACSAWLLLCFCGFYRRDVMDATVCLFPCSPLFGCRLHAPVSYWPLEGAPPDDMTLDWSQVMNFLYTRAQLFPFCIDKEI